MTDTSLDHPKRKMGWQKPLRLQRNLGSRPEEFFVHKIRPTDLIPKQEPPGRSKQNRSLTKRCRLKLATESAVGIWKKVLACQLLGLGWLSCSQTPPRCVPGRP